MSCLLIIVVPIQLFDKLTVRVRACVTTLFTEGGAVDLLSHRVSCRLFGKRIGLTKAAQSTALFADITKSKWTSTDGWTLQWKRPLKRFLTHCTHRVVHSQLGVYNVLSLRPQVIYITSTGTLRTCRPTITKRSTNEFTQWVSERQTLPTLIIPKTVNDCLLLK